MEYFAYVQYVNILIGFKTIQKILCLLIKIQWFYNRSLSLYRIYIMDLLVIGVIPVLGIYNSFHDGTWTL